ncbi:MarR family transcriptional regulator [Flavobacterium sp. MMLR14_040]|uniref:MarR family winged helix-turn-helix transcriptional regulator n=1 Tax=Flavobacterium sp. MMLR14_040 TaxID=3093843 RepID=UPI00298F72CA|nr:MarR family transcriptional regulator [Flavobacterium sp. MMLR14_040]MDW8848956.1 MarR family transcriptional regulator [Flavobacterium sp. MMLR14_040]
MKIEDIKQSGGSLPINKRILLNIIYIQTAFKEDLNEILKFHTLSKEQYDVLVLLRNLNGMCANMYMIQERMTSKTSNTTRLIDKLLHKELVTREECSENRRKIDITITRKGIALLEEVAPKVLAYETKLADNLTSDEKENLNILLEKYRNNNYK